MSAPKERKKKRTSQSPSFFCLFFCPFYVFLCYPKHKKVRDLVRFAAFRLPFFFESQVSLPLLIIAGEKQQNKDDKTTKKKKRKDTPHRLST